MRRNGPVEIYQEIRAERDALRAENLRLREALRDLSDWCPKLAAKRTKGMTVPVPNKYHAQAREAARALLRELGEAV